MKKLLKLKTMLLAFLASSTLFAADPYLSTTVPQDLSCKPVPGEEFEEDHIYSILNNETGKWELKYFDNDSILSLTPWDSQSSSYNFAEETDFRAFVKFTVADKRIVGATAGYDEEIIQFSCSSAELTVPYLPAKSTLEIADENLNVELTNYLADNLEYLEFVGASSLKIEGISLRPNTFECLARTSSFGELIGTCIAWGDLNAQNSTSRFVITVKSAYPGNEAGVLVDVTLIDGEV